MQISFAATAGTLAALALACALAPGASAQLQLDRVNQGVVEIETGNGDGISARIGQDLAELLDDGATRRVVPVLGYGSLQNIADLKALRGIDVAIVETDALEQARSQKLFPNVEMLNYIARLYTEEFHLLARADIKTVADLAGKKVNMEGRGPGGGVTGPKILAALNIKADVTNYPAGLALRKLISGELAAVAVVAAKPAPLLRDIAAGSGLHFLAIPLQPGLAASYAPSRLTNEDYPALIAADAPVDTVATGTVLMVANLQPQSDRYRAVENFVDALFTNFGTLLEPGHQAKWHEVNLAADFAGWRRFPAAQQWLARNATVAKQPGPADLKAVFERFLEERLQITGAGQMTQQQKDELFGQFQRWQAEQVH